MNMVHQITQYAILANTAFRNGVEETKRLKYLAAVLDLLQKFATTNSLKNRITWYFILLVAETLFSSPLLIPLTESIFGSEAIWFQYIMVNAMYATLLFITTGIAAEHLYHGLRKHTELKANLEALQYAGEALPVLQRLASKDVKGNKVVGYLWSGALILMMVLIAILRNFLVNEHHWFVFDTPDDVVLVVVPAILALGLIYLAQYKVWFFLLRMVKKQHKVSVLKVDACKQETLESGKICRELVQTAFHQAQLIHGDKNTETCIQRMETLDASDPDFFSDLLPCDCNVKVLNKGVLVANVSIRACTAGGQMLFQTTDANGCATLSWKATETEAYLTFLEINNYSLQGNRYVAGQQISVNLSGLNNDAEGTTLPTSDKPATPKNDGGGAIAQHKSSANGIDDNTYAIPIAN